MKPLRVLLADDHAVLRAGLRLLVNAQPDLTVVEEAADGPEAIRKTRTVHPDVVVLDLAMPRTDPATVIAQLSRLGSRVVVLTMHDDPAYVEAALAAGAQGFVVKKAADVELLSAIRAVSRGRQFVDAATGPRAGPPRSRRLSPREERVLQLIGYGFTNREIAERLRVGVKTVETFRARVCDKLALRSRAELVRYALRVGLVNPANDVAEAPGPGRR
jgi:two-component system, NarL family, response regulator NreC